MSLGLTIEFIEDANWLGGSIYIDNLLSALSMLSPPSSPRVRLKFLSSQRTPLAKRLMRHSAISGGGLDWGGDMVATARRIHRGLARRAPWLGYLTPKSENELYFPVFDAKQGWRKNLYWIPDFQPHYLPELFNSDELSSRMQSFSNIANSRGILLLSSNAALADFRRFYPDATVEARVWSFCSCIDPSPASACAEVVRKYGLPKMFLYIANQFWRHKDHATAFESLRILRDQGLDIQIVCTGLQNDRRDSAYFGSLKHMLAQFGLQNQVHFLGVVPREEQVQLFRVAAAVLQPSRFEGWSTIIEDAKALGRPIIASDIAVHKEQLSGVAGAYLFKVSDAGNLAQQIATAWPNLSEGPDLQVEMRAIEQGNKWRLASANRFVAIVEEALAYLPDGDNKKREQQ